MDEDLVRGLQVMVAQLVLLSVAIHGAIAARRLRAVLTSGVAPRVVTVLFVLAILGVVVAAIAFRFALVPRRYVYWLLVLIMGGQVVGWFVYHNLSVAGHSHADLTLLQSVIAHFDVEPTEAAATVAELLAVALLAVLLRVDPKAASPARATRNVTDHDA